MRKFFVTWTPTVFVGAGLAVAGTASLQAAYAPGLNTMEASKLWSVSGTLRGFYDDNYNTAPNGPLRRDSFGFELSPSLSLDVPLQQTEIGARATYGLYYYQDRMSQDGRPIDQTGQLDLWLDHAFTERWQAKVQDSLAIGQEPELINQGVPYRLAGSNLHNTGIATVDTQWTRLMGTEISYQNNIYHYSTGYYQGLLDLMQHDLALNVNWRLQPTLLAFVGYQYEQINYTGNETISVGVPTFVSDNRDNRSHYGYVGVQYNPLSNLELDARAGIQYVDYYNPPAGYPSTDSLSPYANISATYTYLPGSYVQFGFTQSRNATDVIAPFGGKVTLDQESSTIFGALNHQITPRITGNLVGKVQYSTFNEGALNNDSQTWYSVGLNLAYAFNPNLSAEVGYNFDYLTAASQNAQIAAGYHRNRIYLGVTGTY